MLVSNRPGTFAPLKVPGRLSVTFLIGCSRKIAFAVADMGAEAFSIVGSGEVGVQ